MRDKNLMPIWGLANLECDEPIVTHCGKTVEPIRYAWTATDEKELALEQALASGAAKLRARRGRGGDGGKGAGGIHAGMGEKDFHKNLWRKELRKTGRMSTR